ncbi:hypothetical protein [Vibrio splendidus]|uniref:hypothetical protein n=1 Tax=Vibrio splendidus TaxID=29497 RepID=UPI001E4A4769|nr:hypothetical protein [Vibrio splendidus]MCC4859812.1 hypothetical protein [Vibrio splendidus]
MESNTINQHFLSQAEQRLNSFNPSARLRNQKIFSYDVLSHDDGTLDNPRSVSISRNLSDLDLYSFSVLDKTVRLNFESEFGRYESDISNATETLLCKVSNGDTDCSAELQQVFILKFLNSIRNPYSYKNTLSFLGSYATYHPTDPKLKTIYDSIENSNKPHLSAICERYGFTPKEYVNWLKAIYLLLFVRDQYGVNILEALARSFYENQNTYIHVIISTYTKGQAVLLSDRGYNQFDDSDSSINYEFNLNSNAHIAYSFADITKALPLEHPLHGNKRVQELFRTLPKEINVSLVTDNEEILTAYNSRTIMQSANKIFCKLGDLIEHGLQQTV